VNQATLEAFVDELEKIAFLARAGRAVAGQVGRGGRWVGGGIKRQAQSVLGGAGLKAGDESALTAAGKLVTSPKRTMSKNFREMGGVDKALLGGFTGAELASAGKKQPNGSRRGATGRVGAALGGAAGWVATRKVPMVGGLIGMGLAAGAGKKLGDKLENKVTGPRR
jgi:hypothetical protein